AFGNRHGQPIRRASRVAGAHGQKSLTSRGTTRARRGRMMKLTTVVLALLCGAGCVSAIADDGPSCTDKCDGQDLEIARDLPAVCSSPEVIRIDRPVWDGNTS